VTSLGIDFYGRLLWCGLAGLAGAGIGRALGRRGTPAWAMYGAVWVGSLVFLTVALELALLWRRIPVPLLPPGP
jgi:hypothetical protein